MRSDNMPRPFAPEHGETDIVDRLRTWRNWSVTEDRRCASEAADEIERLRMHISQLTGEPFSERNHAALQARARHAEAERDKLRERIEKAPLRTLSRVDVSSWDIPDSWSGKSAKLVVEEG